MDDVERNRSATIGSIGKFGLLGLSWLICLDARFLRIPNLIIMSRVVRLVGVLVRHDGEEQFSQAVLESD